MAPIQETVPERLIYNGVVMRVYKSEMSSDPIPDEANRTTVYVQHTLELTAWILAGDQPSDSTDTTMQDIRRKLTQPGAIMFHRFKGFGALIVNSTLQYPEQIGVPKDVAFGPWPKILSWTPVGDNRAAMIRYRLVTKIPECPTAKYRNWILAYNYSEGFDIDVDGLTVIAINGYLEIPMTRPRQGDRRLPDGVDTYREQVKPEIPAGFQLETQNFKTSYDKRRLDFTFRLKQLPIALPDHITRANIDHEISSNLSQYAFVRWMGSVSGSMTVAAGEAKETAWLRFAAIALERFALRNEALAGGRRPVLMIESVRVREEVFGLTSHFSIGYWLFMPRNFREIFRVSGLWRPVGTQFRRWRDSVSESSHHVRGAARIYGSGGPFYTDVILDLCSTNRQTVPPAPEGREPDPRRGGFSSRRGGFSSFPGQRPPAGPTGDFPSLTGFIEGGKGPDLTGFIPSGGAGGVNAARGRRSASRAGIEKGNSWLSYRAKLVYSETPRLARHKPMGGTVTVSSRPKAEGQSGRIAIEDDGTPSSVVASTGDILHEVATPSATLRFQGNAVRIGYRIPIPALVRVGQQTVHLDHVARMADEVISMWGDIPIYRTTWDIVYQLEKPLQEQLPTLANPHFGLDGDG